MRVKTWIIGVALVALATLGGLGGCSTMRLAYNQAPDLAYWWLDGYADFDDEQTPRVRAALAEWFQWHRASQLRDYAELLARVRQRGLDDIDAAQACAWSADVRRRLERAYERAVPAAADLVMRLRPEQLQHMARRYQKGNDERQRDHLHPVPAERAAAALKRTLERAESLYGPLDERQRQWLASALPASPFDPEAWQAERRQAQQHTLDVLGRLVAERADAAAAQAALRALSVQTFQSPRPAYRAYQERLLSFNCALAAQLHNTTTAAQRQRAADKLKGWEDDLRALAQAGNVISPAAAAPAAR